jgi:hypothetical protein
VIILSFGICFWAKASKATGSIPEANAAAAISLKDWDFAFAGNDTAATDSSFVSGHRLERIAIPHVFPRKAHKKIPARGIGWYFRDVEIPRSFIDKAVYLDFEGVCLRAKVFTDGVFAGGCDFAYMPFTVDLTTLTRGKTHFRLAVRVDNRLLARQIPDEKAKGWWIQGGLLREVRLCRRSLQRIHSASIRTTYCAPDTFDLRLSLKPSSAAWDSVIITVEPPDRNIPYFKATMLGTDTTFRLGGIRSWTPESPYRYGISFVPFFKGTPGDTLGMFRGFCHLAVKNGTLCLNGRPYYLQGMARHDVIGADDRPPTREERLKDLLDMKDLGVNFLRIAHFPQHRDIYEICDSIGLIIMDEIPAWKTAPTFLGSKEGQEYGAAYLERLIEAHGNYTSVCLWSVGNQFASYASSSADYVREVRNKIKKTDPARLVTFCSCYYTWDKAFSYVDVISINEYFGWELASLGLLPGMLDNIHRDWPDKPILVSEVGAQAKLGLRNSRPKLAGMVKSLFSKDLSEDHQALFIGSHLDSIRNKQRFVWGAVIWAYADYMSYLNKARTADMPAGLNACGVVTSDRKNKLLHDIVKQRYGAIRDRFAAKP